MTREEKLNNLCYELKNKGMNNLMVVRLSRDWYMLKHKEMRAGISTKTNNLRFKKCYTYKELETILKNILKSC